MLRFRLFRSFLLLVASAVIVAACGPLGDEAEPTPTVNALRPAEENELSVNDVLSRVEEAWLTVDSMQVTTVWGNDLLSASSTATPAVPLQRSIATIKRPNEQHHINTLGGVTQEEVIYVDGSLYARGSRMHGWIAPNVNPEMWVKVEPSTLPEDLHMRYYLESRRALPEAPFANVEATTRQNVATDIGNVEVEGRTCHGYTFAEDSADLGLWDIELTIDDETNLPCRLVRTTNSSYQGITMFQFNMPDVRIERPGTWVPAPVPGPATPRVGPLGLPSTGPLATPAPAAPVASPAGTPSATIRTAISKGLA